MGNPACPNSSNLTGKIMESIPCWAKILAPILALYPTLQCTQIGLPFGTLAIFIRKMVTSACSLANGILSDPSMCPACASASDLTSNTNLLGTSFISAMDANLGMVISPPFSAHSLMVKLLAPKALYPTLASLSAISWPFSFSAKMSSYFLGSKRLPAHVLKVPPSGSKNAPLIQPSLTCSMLVRVSTTGWPFAIYYLYWSTERGVLLSLTCSWKWVGPWRFSEESWEKYWGGGAKLPTRIFTNSSRLWIFRAQLFSSCFSKVQLLPSPMDFPQADPEPCPGRIVNFPSNFLIFCSESKSVAASSSTLCSELTAKSGLPTSPKNSVSPVKSTRGLPSLSSSKQETLSRVCPGVATPTTFTYPRGTLSPSLSSLTSKPTSRSLAPGPITTGTLYSRCPDTQSAWKWVSRMYFTSDPVFLRWEAQAEMSMVGSISRALPEDSTRYDRTASSPVLNCEIVQPGPEQDSTSWVCIFNSLVRNRNCTGYLENVNDASFVRGTNYLQMG